VPPDVDSKGAAFVDPASKVLHPKKRTLECPPDFSGIRPVLAVRVSSANGSSLPATDIGRRRKRTLKPMEAAIQLAATGVAPTIFRTSDVQNPAIAGGP
jgi:hypothetical protein